ncbi:hypothetical protein KKI24_10900, partial [bacterium]|nr:hypothetical protein [bacterium]
GYHSDWLTHFYPLKPRSKQGEIEKNNVIDWYLSFNKPVLPDIFDRTHKPNRRYPMQSKKPRKDPLEDPQFAAFVHAAENGPLVVKENALEGNEESRSHKEELPWQNRNFSKKLKPFMNFSLDQEYIEKLRWFSRKTNKGQQEIIRLLLRPFLDTEIEKLLRNQVS